MLHPIPCPKHPAMLLSPLCTLLPRQQAKRVGKGHPHPGNSWCSGDVPAGVPARQPPCHLALAHLVGVPARHAAPHFGAWKLLPSQQRRRGIATERLQSRPQAADFFLFFFFLHISMHSLQAWREKTKQKKWQNGSKKARSGGMHGLTCLTCSPTPPGGEGLCQAPVQFCLPGRDQSPGPGWDLGAKTTPLRSTSRAPRVQMHFKSSPNPDGPG